VKKKVEKESHKVAFWAPEAFCYFEDLFAGISFFAFKFFLMYALCFSSDIFAISKKDQYSIYKEGNHYHANNNEFVNLEEIYKKEKQKNWECKQDFVFLLLLLSYKWNQYFDL